MTAIDCAYSIKGEGPAVFMIHGIGSRRTTWNGLIQHLNKDFTCIIYDLRGHGDSPVPYEQFGLEELVDDLEALRQKLEIEQAHFIGHSLGGMIGPAYARAYPAKVLSVGLLSTAAGRTADDSAKVNAVGRAMREKGIKQVLPTLVDRWFTAAFAQANPDAIERRLQQVIDTPEQVFLNVFDIYATTEMAPWLHEVTAPCLVLTGELDGGCNPRLSRFIANKLPNSELVILEGLKHSILIEASDRVAHHVKSFLLKHQLVSETLIY